MEKVEVVMVVSIIKIGANDFIGSEKEREREIQDPKVKELALTNVLVDILFLFFEFLFFVLFFSFFFFLSFFSRVEFPRLVSDLADILTDCQE